MPEVITVQLLVAGVVLVGAALWAREDARRLAAVVGFLLPVDSITGIPTVALQVLPYLAIGWLALRVDPVISPSADRHVKWLACSIATAGVLRVAFALGRGDRASVVIGLIWVAGAGAGYLIGRRSQVHPPMVAGFLAGIVFSASVSIMQALHIPTLREGNIDGDRYPGLSSDTMYITWYLAVALIVAIALILRRPHTRVQLGLLVTTVCIVSMAMFTNGAQGGFLCLITAAVATAWHVRRHLTWRRMLVAIGGPIAAMAVLLLFASITGIRVPSIDGLLGDGDYVNEIARWKINSIGVEELMADPWVGMGRTEFLDKHNLAPHFPPLELAAEAGVLGLVVASGLVVYLFWLTFRPGDDRSWTAVTGFAVLGGLTGTALTYSTGPFAGLSVVALLFVAVVASHATGASSASEAWGVTTDGSVTLEPPPVGSRSDP